MPANSALIETHHLFKSYFNDDVETPVLFDINVKIEKGEFVAIMGPSGSGKSTLMHLLGLLDTPDKGTMRLFGQDITHLSEEEHAFLRNKAIGFVFQQFNLMSRSTALENVALPLFYSEQASNETLLDENPKRLLEQVGLGERMEHRPNELSGGQQQRVAIARALVNHPLVILADEPTGDRKSVV